MSVRTDVHCPSQINPNDYQFVCFEYIKVEGIGDCEYLIRQREILRAHMARTGGTYSTHAHGGNCMVCGNAMAIYTVLFYHPNTNTYIRMGQDCAAKVEMSCGDWNAFRAAVGNALAHKAGKAKAEAFLATENLTSAWDLFNAETRETKWEENTICDIVGKLVKYGSISPKQVGFVRGLLGKIAQRGVVELQRKAEHDSAADCPTGRITITGKVLAVKCQDSYYGEQYKVLVQSDAGYKVWGSQFKVDGAYVGKGDLVSFKGTVEPSKDDKKFGFFKRPVGLTCQVDADTMVASN